MTRTRIILVALLLALGVAACGPGSSTSPKAIRSSDPPVIEGPELGPAPTEVSTAREPVEVRPPFAEDPPVKKSAPDPILLPGQPPAEDRDAKEPPPEKDPPIGKELVPLIKDRQVLFFENSKNGPRRVHIVAEVCLQRGALLEVLLCKTMTKEHETILRVDVDARMIHAALEAAGAKKGSPVQFFNEKTEKEEYKPARGDTIKITLTYYKDGKLRTDPAQYWIRDVKTKKDIAHDWVFAGSRLYQRPPDPDAKPGEQQPPPYYCANNGDIISIANSVEAMLDLPIKSPRENADLAFEPNTARIPSFRTKVLVTLEPVSEKKEKK